MPGARGRAVLAAVMVAAFGALSGCGGGGGGDGEIPPETAESMLAIADEIEAANADGDCETAQARTTDLRNEVEGLDGGETKQALDAMVTRLDENLDADCVEEGTTDTEPEETTETTTPAPAEPTTTTQTTTTETTAPPEEEEEPQTPEQPPGEGGGPNGPPAGGGGGGGGSVPPTGGVDEG